MGNFLAIFADGTWNDPSDRTNVQRLFNALTGTSKTYDVSDQIGEYIQKVDYHQIAFYLDGVGSNGNWKDILAGATGIGLHSKVLDAYLLLSQIYTDSSDIISLFGFSRGAYTVRSLAGMISSMGLIAHEHAFSDEVRNLANDIWLCHKSETKTKYSIFSKIFHRNRDELAKYMTAIPKIKSVCVWDTVGALGIPVINKNPTVEAWQQNFFDFADTKLSPNVECGVQALALDERRDAYQPCLWDARENVIQRWFPGAHCDVGGGYPVHGLSDVALDWMISVIPPSTLSLYPILEDFAPNPNSQIHNECNTFPFAGTCNTIRDIRKIEIDGSVKVRMLNDKAYQPEQLKQ